MSVYNSWVPIDLENTIKSAVNDHSAFQEVYNMTIDRIFAFVLFRTKDRGEALEICQEIYLSLWKSLPKFVYISDAHFFSFVFMVARRQIIKARIKRRDYISIDEILDIPSEEREKNDYRLLLQAVSKLGEKERNIIELRYFGDASFSEIKDALNISENHAKVIHYRAIKKLQKILHDYE